ncbi:hypothetical protein BRADI_4g06063v3 [Brachypodium distachyon]|uniref:Uncharacterized protein n=1 Tax=Brachypodium distachyon TaxID=15368 RepID=A0A0Q3IJX6_BRADI|nr:hypothetical protein BRADI_4g06063v3 [Brachypodium distachyon]KQJ86521.1 hypothetical protein BRADI_4g06063v3 [Brachypodium distachyon]
MASCGSCWSHQNLCVLVARPPRREKRRWQGDSQHPCCRFALSAQAGPGKRDRKTELKNRILETQAESPSPSRLSQPIAGFGFSGSRAHWSFF